MNEENKEKAIKLIARLCKEARIFPGYFYKNIINFIDKNDSYVFYGRDNIGYTRFGIGYEIRFFKLQLEIIKILIENDLLERNDYYIVLRDTLGRYDANGIYRWGEVAKAVSKKEFTDFFFKVYEKKIGTIDKNEKARIIRGLPKD